MADRETVVEVGRDNSGAVVVAIIVVVLLFVGFLVFNGTLRLDSATPANTVTIDVPNAGPEVTVTTPEAK